MEKLKQLGAREAGQTMLQGKACAEVLLGMADGTGLDDMSAGHREAFWLGMMAALCGHMAAMVGATTGSEIVESCRTGMFAAEAAFRKKEAH